MRMQTKVFSLKLKLSVNQVDECTIVGSWHHHLFGSMLRIYCLDSYIMVASTCAIHGQEVLNPFLYKKDKFLWKNCRHCFLVNNFTFGENLWWIVINDIMYFTCKYDVLITYATTVITITSTTDSTINTTNATTMAFTITIDFQLLKLILHLLLPLLYYFHYNEDCYIYYLYYSYCYYIYYYYYYLYCYYYYD